MYGVLNSAMAALLPPYNAARCAAGSPGQHLMARNMAAITDKRKNSESNLRWLSLAASRHGAAGWRSGFRLAVRYFGCVMAWLGGKAMAQRATFMAESRRLERYRLLASGGVASRQWRSVTTYSLCDGCAIWRGLAKILRLAATASRPYKHGSRQTNRRGI